MILMAHQALENNIVTQPVVKPLEINGEVINNQDNPELVPLLILGTKLVQIRTLVMEEPLTHRLGIIVLSNSQPLETLASATSPTQV